MYILYKFIFINLIDVHSLYVVMGFSLFTLKFVMFFGLVHSHIIFFLIFYPVLSGSHVEKAIFPPIQVFSLFI